MSLTLRGIKGSALTIAELDNNFVYLNGRDIAGVGLIGCDLTITRNDGSNFSVNLSGCTGGGGTSSGDTYVTTGYTSNNILYLVRNDAVVIEIPLNIELSGATVIYNNATATPTTIGGIAAGSTFTNQTMQQMWDALLYPYQYPAFSSFSLGITSPKEIGYDITTAQTFTWGTTNSSNVSANTITIAGYNLTTLSGLANDGSEPVVFTGIITRSSVDGPGSRSWSIQGVNTQNNNFSSSLAIRWDWKLYVGSSLNTSLTEPQIEALTVYNSVKNGFTGTYIFPFAFPSEYRYFCFATTYGTPNAFTDTLTSFPVPMYLGYSNIDGNGNSYDLVSVTNIESETTNYRVYRTLNALGSVTIQVT